MRGSRIGWQRYFDRAVGKATWVSQISAHRRSLPAELYLDNHHEDLVLSVEQTLKRLCGFLGLPAMPEHAQAVKGAGLCHTQGDASERFVAA